MHYPGASIQLINDVFKKAVDDDREVLYEHEIYRILDIIGLDVPKFEFVAEINHVDEKLLEKFGQDLIVKVVSPDIAHKQKLGGVKKIKKVEPLFVQFVLNKMKEEVLSHFSEKEKPDIRGFLIAEFVPHSQGIGYEVLIGFREDPAFGPVLTFSKGGDDAEFFAKYYDPANLFLLPLDREAAVKMVNTMNIRHKFQQTGKLDYLELYAGAVTRISNFAYNYSFIAAEKPGFIVKAMDINPFAITEDNRMVALDGFAQFIPASEDNKKVPEINLTNLDCFFNPEGIAVIGVSRDTEHYSLGRDIALLLHDLGRPDIYLVNPKGGALVLGDKEYPLYKSVAEIPGKVELAVYAAPARNTLDFIRELPAGGPKAVILISGIPADMKYAEYAKQLDAVLPEGMRIIGPNCMGVFHAPDEKSKGLNTLFINEERLEVKHSRCSNVAMLTQSGALAVTAIDRLQNSRLFNTVVSFGNKYDVKITDLIAYFADKKNIDVISLYLEGLDAGEGRQFFQLAGKIKKPVIAYKSGKTEAGAKAAASHTASMSGSYDVFKAACSQTGVILVEDINDHYDYVKAFSLLAGKLPGGNRVAGVVNAGFESTVGADELINLRQAQLSGATIEKMNRINRYGLADTSSPFIDITPMADDGMYADFIRAILEDDNVDCVFVAIVPHSVNLKTTPETCRDADSLANLIVELGRQYDKPMAVSVNAGRYYQEFVSIMEGNGLPVYNDIRSAIKSLDAFVSFHTHGRA